jgi:hypothetical protein
LSEDRTPPAEEIPEDDAPPAVDRALKRGGDLLGRQGSRVRKKLAELWPSIKKGFEDQSGRADKQMDYWDAYNCRLNDNQYYEGDAQIYVPIVHDAINAVVTRLSNQLFPEGGHYVDVVSDEPSEPHGIVALLDKYIRAGKLKTRVCKPLIRHGYVEGQLNLYVDWSEIDRQVVSRETHGPTVTIAGEDIEVPGEDIEDIVVEDDVEARPACEVLHDSDVLIWPTSADTIDEAMAAGGGYAIVRRWSKAKVEAMCDAGMLNKEEGKKLLAAMGEASSSTKAGTPPDAEKLLAEMVGIRKKGSEATVWETGHLLTLGADGKYDDDGPRRIVRTFFGPDGSPLGCVRNPHWNDRVPLLSEPVEKIGGVFKGKSQVEGVISLQYEANDAANEGADVAHMAAMPIVIRDPASGKQPLIMNIGAIWDLPPNAVKFAEFPDLTPRAIQRIQYCISQVFQSLSVNPSMLPQQTSTSKRNQAQVAQEQQVDLLTTTEAGAVLGGEEGIFTDLMSWFVDLDYQYRDKETTARHYGLMGKRAILEAIPPQQTRTRYSFEWAGMQMARNAQQFQQQIGFINIARGVEPLLAKEGKQLQIGVAIEKAAMGIFGPHVGPQIILDLRESMSVDAEFENELLDQGFDLPVHVLDDFQAHMRAHMQGKQQTGNPSYDIHMRRHIIADGIKRQAQMQAQQQAGMQGGQQGQRPSRGGAPPRQGAMPAGPQLVKGPPGAIHPDQMPRAGAVPMPRR